MHFIACYYCSACLILPQGIKQACMILYTQGIKQYCQGIVKLIACSCSVFMILPQGILL